MSPVCGGREGTKLPVVENNSSKTPNSSLNTSSFLLSLFLFLLLYVSDMDIHPDTEAVKLKITVDRAFPPPHQITQLTIKSFLNCFWTLYLPVSMPWPSTGFWCSFPRLLPLHYCPSFSAVTLLSFSQFPTVLPEISFEAVIVLLSDLAFVGSLLSLEGPI